MFAAGLANIGAWTEKGRCANLRISTHLPTRRIAEMCGVSPTTVTTVRLEPIQVSKLDTSPETVIGRDGKSYPAHRQTEPPQTLSRRRFRADMGTREAGQVITLPGLF